MISASDRIRCPGFDHHWRFSFNLLDMYCNHRSFQQAREALFRLCHCAGWSGARFSFAIRVISLAAAHICRWLLLSRTLITQNLLKPIIILVLLNPDIPCLCKQWRIRSVGFWTNWSALFVMKYVHFYKQSGSNNLTGRKLEVGVAS